MLFTSCAPTFSDLQSARTVGKNHIEATPLYSVSDYHEDKASYKMQNHIGIQTAYGITSRLDLRARYEYISQRDVTSPYHYSVIGFGPKFSLLENKIAFSLPIGCAFGNEIQTNWQAHPTLLFTLPVTTAKMEIELTLAPKYMITFTEDSEDYFAVNANAAFSTNLNRWAIRPEFGVLVNPGDPGFITHFSIALSVNFGREKETAK